MKIIKFSTTWCGPCKAYKPIWESVKEKHPEIIWSELDAEENVDEATQFKVRAVPFTIFIDGDKSKSVAGLLNAQQLENYINEFKN